MVECAKNASTYVTVYTFTPKVVKHYIESGYKGIKHVNLLAQLRRHLMCEDHL